MFSEKNELVNKLDTLRKELGKTPESLSHQVHNITEMNESLT